METIKDLRVWMKILNRFGGNIEDVSGSGQPGEERISFRLYTDTNRYSFTAIDRERNSYLGCIANSRKPRAGEGWNRGRDLADGSLSHETWIKILADIISYEMVAVHLPKDPLQDLSGGSSTGPSIEGGAGNV